MFEKSPAAYRASFPPAVSQVVVPSCVVRVYGRPQHRPAGEGLKNANSLLGGSDGLIEPAEQRLDRSPRGAAQVAQFQREAGLAATRERRLSASKGENSRLVTLQHSADQVAARRTMA